MIRFAKLMALIAVLVTPVAAAAQLNLPSKLTYTVGLERDPRPAGPVPADSEMAPIATETTSLVGYIGATGADEYLDVSNKPGYQAKARFTCAETGIVGYLDQIRLPGLRPAGHLHDFFGGMSVDKDITTYAQIRADALRLHAAGKIASRCPGDFINPSLYWKTALTKPNAMGDGVRRVKRSNLITLYYEIDHPEEAKWLEYLRPGIKLLFGRNMDDPNMLRLKALVDAAQAANPSLALKWTGPAHGDFRCGDSQDRYESLANADGSAAFTCPTSEQIFETVTSNECWNGHLSAPDGYSNTIPAIHSDADGKDHCPLEYGYRLPRVSQTARYSHLGPDDYRQWECSADQMMATTLGQPVKGCASLHMDYVFAWLKAISDRWQCAIGLPIPGRDCSVPHAMQFDTIGPNENGVIERLVKEVTPTSGGKPLVDLNTAYTGKKLSDWGNMPAMSMPPHVMGSGGAIEVH